MPVGAADQKRHVPPTLIALILKKSGESAAVERLPACIQRDQICAVRR